ncbi:MAG TPA: ADP-ribosylation factor-like protein [Candidatus Lokiarchaeia archaeon]|nr:ADP-ribosylation factor-like protein [Candidatus Lokiarchaeia archaeon]
MSEPPDKMQLLVDAISKRFLKEDQAFNSVQEILEAPISALKKVNDKVAKLLEEAAFITKIEDLVEIDPANPFESMMQGKGDVEDPIKFSMLKDNIINRLTDIISIELMRDIIVAARLISRAEKKQSFYLKEKKEQKILFLGLDNAGKTAIINVLGGRINPSHIRKLKPTKKVQREKIVTKDFEIHVWDLGGQKEYRENYLQKENLEMFFLQTDLIVYVIDMQDMGRLPESLGYLEQILDAFKYLGENPFVMIFLHKSDPDIIEDPMFLMNIESVKDGLLDLMKKFEFDYDAFPTSIFYMYSREAKLTNVIKGVLNEQKETEGSKKESARSMSEILDTTMNLTVNLSNIMEEQFTKMTTWIGQIERRLSRIESTLQATYPELGVQKEMELGVGTPGAPAMAPLPPGINPPPPMAESPQSVISSQQVQPHHENIRSTMMSELKQIFAKKRMDSST